MNVSAINPIRFGAALNAPKLSKTMNRSLLKNTTSNLKPLCGPEEVKLAKKAVAAYTAENALLGAATAQMCGGEEFLLGGVEVAMALSIFNGIYGFKLNKVMVRSLLTGLAGIGIGTAAFKAASKFLTWIPGLGNGLNATVAGTTTAILGNSIIELAEEMDKARKNGEKLDRFFKRIEGNN